MTTDPAATPLPTPATPPSSPLPVGTIKQTSGDWPEDFSHENGNYSCRCCVCEKLFTGHKRRVCCKLCDDRPPAARSADLAAETPAGVTEGDGWNTETARELLSALFVLPAVMHTPDPEKVERVAKKIAAKIASATAAAVALERARLTTPPTAMRDCTLDELVEQLGPEHLAAKQIAGLRAIIKNRRGISHLDLNVHGSVALMRKLAKAEQALAAEVKEKRVFAERATAAKLRRDEIEIILAGESSAHCDTKSDLTSARAELAKLHGFYDEIVKCCGHDQIVREYEQRGRLLSDEANRRKEAEAWLATAIKERDEWKAMAERLDAKVIDEQRDHVKTCGDHDATKAHLTEVLKERDEARAELEQSKDNAAKWCAANDRQIAVIQKQRAALTTAREDAAKWRELADDFHAATINFLAAWPTAHDPKWFMSSMEPIIPWFRSAENVYRSATSTDAGKEEKAS